MRLSSSLHMLRIERIPPLHTPKHASNFLKFYVLYCIYNDPAWKSICSQTSAAFRFQCSGGWVKVALFFLGVHQICHLVLGAWFFLVRCFQSLLKAIASKAVFMDWGNLNRGVFPLLWGHMNSKIALQGIGVCTNSRLLTYHAWKPWVLFSTLKGCLNREKSILLTQRCSRPRSLMNRWIHRGEQGSLDGHYHCLNEVSLLVTPVKSWMHWKETRRTFSTGRSCENNNKLWKTSI